MKVYGSLSELLSVIFKKNNQAITFRPNNSTTFTAARDIQTPPRNGDEVLVGELATQTLSNKTLTAPTISSPAFSGITTGTFTLVGATIDGDTNTLQDIGIASLKTDAAAANQVILRDGSGVVTDALVVNANVDAAAAIARTKLANGSVNHVVINDGSGTFSSEAQLAISRGGTGQSSATAAFNALSPTTTKGDIIVYNGTDNIRLAAGALNQVLAADSSTASGLKWATAGAGDITNGGNSFGSAITLGTNDNFALNFETNGTVIATGSTAGVWTLGSTTASGTSVTRHIVSSPARTYVRFQGLGTDSDAVLESFATGSSGGGLDFYGGTGTGTSSGTARWLFRNAGADGTGTANRLYWYSYGTSSETGSIAYTTGAWTLGTTSTSFVGNNIQGKKNGAAVGAGFVGETLTGSWLTPTITTSQVNMMSLDLTAGVWVVYGKAQVGTAGTTQTRFEASLSTTSATLNNKSTVQDNFAGTTADRLIAPNPIYVNVSSTTTVYLVVRSTHTGANPTPTQAFNELYAVRVG